MQRTCCVGVFTVLLLLLQSTSSQVFDVEQNTRQTGDAVQVHKRKLNHRPDRKEDRSGHRKVLFYEWSAGGDKPTKRIRHVYFDNIDCTTPSGEGGTCINIRRCQSLLDILLTQGNAAGNYLRSSVCGFEGLDPRVCCPSGSQSMTSAPLTTPMAGRQVASYGPLYPNECGLSNATYTRVVGGIPAKLGAWPWIVALGYKATRAGNPPKWLCGGTLVSSRHIITAGHCVFNRKDLYLVRLGDLDLVSDNDGANPIDIPIEKITIHPDYDPSHYTNDIAVIRMERNVPFSQNIHPICLPLEDNIRQRNFTRMFPFVAGWGAVYFNGPSSTRLLQLQIPVVSPEACAKAFEPFKSTVIDDRVLCAGFARGGKDACQGDSGGPLMFPLGRISYLIGVVSYGHKCAEPGYPGVYTRVTSFLDFIQANLV
ncbi:venom protease-like isoform X1 [Neodiprion virginianus]|uniref:venom protease-like isoform X1 n=1 Tax=Neodiprion virginianus TaxID=2961670 RepID=UPI001EE73009|nr:venom protease-like isoform X1 [Neodiprion virginianus]